MYNNYVISCFEESLLIGPDAVYQLSFPGTIMLELLYIHYVFCEPLAYL